MRKRLHPILFRAMPFLLSSADALAWGLATHAYFAQLLLWSVLLPDRRFCSALLRFPGLVLAGACLPELELFGRRGPAPGPATAPTSGDCHRRAHERDSGLRRRFDFYVAETSARLADINRLPAGEWPAWEAEVPDGKPEIAKPEALRQLLAEGLPLPLELYNDRDSAAIAAPTTAPASTSLG